MSDMPVVRGRLTQDAPLAPLVWFKAGGAAAWLFEPADADFTITHLFMASAAAWSAASAFASIVMSVMVGFLPGLSVERALGV